MQHETQLNVRLFCLSDWSVLILESQIAKSIGGGNVSRNFFGDA